MPELDLFLQTCVNAVYAASFMALIAVGLVLIFGVMGVINFAHGELYMLGAYAVVYFYVDQQFSYFFAVAVGPDFRRLSGNRHGTDFVPPPARQSPWAG